MTRLLPIVLLLISGGIFFGYINPTIMGPIAQTSSKIKQYDAALSAADRFGQKQTSLAQEQQALPADGVARLQSFLPDSVDNVQLILDLDALAARSGVKITNFNTTEVAKPVAPSSSVDTSTTVSFDPSKPYDSLDISMTASGSYSQVRTFLSGVERSLRPLDLIQFQVTDSPTGVYLYQMTFRLYWLR